MYYIYLSVYICVCLCMYIYVNTERGNTQEFSVLLLQIFYRLETIGEELNLQVSFCSVQLFSRVWLFVTSWTAARQASLSITNYQSLPKLRSIESVMPSISSSVAPFSSCLQSFPVSGQSFHCCLLILEACPWLGDLDILFFFFFKKCWCALLPKQIGPEKGVVHLATAAVLNAVWDLWAKQEGKVILQQHPWLHGTYGTQQRNTTPSVGKGT